MSALDTIMHAERCKFGKPWTDSRGKTWSQVAAEDETWAAARAELTALRAELERARPIVEAARALVAESDHGDLSNHQVEYGIWLSLQEAVRSESAARVSE